MSDYTPSGKRRRYDPSFKAMIIELCRDPKNSVAKIAQTHQLNPNLVHKWIWRARKSGEVTTHPGFLPVPLSSVTPQRITDTGSAVTSATVSIKIDSRLGQITLTCSTDDSITLIKSLLS